jgi:glycosyltransferase involved in cell wall biosynthesis
MATAPLHSDRRAPEPAQSPGWIRLARPDGVRLVVIIPALNEERTVGDVIRRIPRDLPGVDQVLVVLVDDGSQDQTGRIAAGLGAVVVRHPRPSGVGAAFQSGLRAAFELGADVVVNIDADGQFAPEDIPKLIAPIVDGRADFVTASRFLDPALTPEMPPVKKWGNHRMSRLISALTGSKFHDVSCGMRAYNRRAALSLSLVGSFTYTQEVFLNLTSKKMNIMEVPIAVRGQREFGTSRVAGSIIRYATNTAKIIFRCYRDYYSMSFFGRIAAILMALGAGLAGFLLLHYFTTGSFSPHKWAGFAGATFIGLGVLSLLMGMLGDMLNRHRIYLEEILYHVRAHSVQDHRKGA